MDSGTQALDAAGILAAARRARAAANAPRPGCWRPQCSGRWLHQVTDREDAATWLVEHGRDTGIPIAGQGCPLVAQFAVAELATALGLSAGSGRRLVAEALELACRLPRIWARVEAGTLPAWRARRIAEETLCLSPEAAEHVDAQLARYAHRTGPAQTQRLVDAAIARFMPDLAAERRQAAADGRHFDIDLDQISFAGTARIDAELDLADALDLDDALRAGAAQLATLGSTETLDVRRSVAAGDLARRQLALGFHTEAGENGGESGGGSGGGQITANPDPGRFGSQSGRGIAGRSRGREVVLYVHLSHDALTSGEQDVPVQVSGAGGWAGGQLLTTGQIAEWCARDDTTRVSVKPVLDLAAYTAVDAHDPPAAMAEQVRLRDRTCVHPWCQRPAGGCDLDHLIPYIPLEEGGPPGQTNPLNLAPLCRLHHRMKTHAGWTYSMVEPGVFLWHGPHGHTWLRDHTGTTDLTPAEVDPPPRRTT